MLCFLFAALIVALDQFFKRWIIRSLGIGEIGPELIPGVLGLTRWENDGAMLNILSGQQWLLAGIAFGAAIVLIMILLRYNEGFWGTLGLAAVLGGTVGNLADRIFNDGKVVDMFRTLPFNFPIFNIADIFITLGFITFLIHFIAISFGADKEERSAADYATDEYQDDYQDDYQDEYQDDSYDEFSDIDAAVSAQAEQDVASSYEPEPRYSSRTRQAPEPQYSSRTRQAPESRSSSKPRQVPESRYSPEPQDTTEHLYSAEPQYIAESQYTFEPQQTDESLYSTEPVDPIRNDYESITDTTPDTSFSMDDLEAELGSLEEYNLDDILREYGIENDDNLF